MHNEIIALKHSLRTTQHEVLYFKLLHYFQNQGANAYREELDYLRTTGNIALFPYRQLHQLGKVEAFFDEKKKLPYVLHKTSRKLFFPATFSLDMAIDMYRSLVEEQGILGGDFYEKAPHQYQTDAFRVKPGDIVLDIGAAEGLFALDVIDIAAKVYLFEADKQWLPPLAATFEPFRNKVEIIPKLVATENTSNKTRLDTCLAGEAVTGLFLKMDIEGDECQVLDGNIELFQNSDWEIRVACCTYHTQHDAEHLQQFFQELNFDVEFSDGYMIFVHDEIQQPPYFRKGLIRARNKALTA